MTHPVTFRAAFGDFPLHRLAQAFILTLAVAIAGLVTGLAVVW